MNNELATKSDVKKVSDAAKRMEWVMWAVVVGLLIGFSATFISATALMWEAWTTKAATYQELQNKVDEYSDKVDALTKAQEDNQALLIDMRRLIINSNTP